jgi:site-specific recombinase XerD
MKGCRPLTDHEALSVLANLNSFRDKCLFILGCRTGFRISELLSLKVKDVWQHGSVPEYVKVERCKTKGKIRSRALKLHPTAKEAVKALVGQDSDPEQFLFKSREGVNQPISYSQANYILKQAYSAAKLTGNLATHTLRKTFAHKFYKGSGHDLLKLSKALDHSDVRNTQRYIEIDQESIDEVIMAG